MTTSGPYTGVVERQRMADQAMTDGSIHTRVFKPGGLWHKDADDMKLRGFAATPHDPPEDTPLSARSRMPNVHMHVYRNPKPKQNLYM